MKIFRFFFSDERPEDKTTRHVKQMVLPDGRGWTDPDSLIRSEGAKLHFKDVERIMLEQERRRREAAAAER